MMKTLFYGSAALALAVGYAVPVRAQQTAAEIEEIVVIGRASQVELTDSYAGGQVARGGRAGLLGNLDMMDAPYAGTAYTADLISQQQAISVADVLRNDPTVRVARGFGNFQELYVIRGFAVYSDDMTYNGVYGILPRQFLAAELVERVEVFRGANAFLNGAAPGGSGVGGAINIVPKRAPTNPLNRVTLGYESDGQIYGAVDLARRFGPGKEWGARVNAVHRDGKTGVDGEDRNLDVVSLGVDYQGERFRFSADAGYQDHHIDSPRPSVTPSGGIPDAPDASTNFAQPWTYTDEQQLFGAVRGEYDITDAITVWAAAGGRDGKEHNVLANPTAAADGSITNSRFDNARKDKVLSADVGVRGDFKTGAIGHRVVLSGSAISTKGLNAYAVSDSFNAGTLRNTVRVAAPATPYVGGNLNDPRKTEQTDNSSVALADMLSFWDGKVLLTVGARYQEIETRGFAYGTAVETSRYKDHAVTPAVALVYKPTEQISLYANYAEALQPGSVVPERNTSNQTYVNANQVLSPFKAKQYETGAKYDGGRFGGSLSLFSITLPNTVEEPAGTQVRLTKDGEQRNRGVELSVFGEPVEDVKVIGGLTYLDAELRKTQGGANEGNTAVGVPDWQANITVTWDVPVIAGLSLDTRLTYTDSQYINAANTAKAPSWTRWDLGVSYTTAFAGKDVTLRGRVENVTDEKDWVSVGGYPGANYLVLGAPRTFLLSASLDF